jgi:hypothetical protein
LAIRAGVIVGPDTGAPCCPVIGREPHEYIHIVVLIHRFVGIDQINSAVARAAASVVSQACFGINRATRLGRDIIETANICSGGSYSRTKTGTPNAIRIEVNEDRGRPFTFARVSRIAVAVVIGTGGSSLICNQHLPSRADRDIAEVSAC